MPLLGNNGVHSLIFNDKGVVYLMRDTFDRIFKLGLGAVVAGKEQIEKTVDELVEKGDITHNESKALVDELLQKGQETKQQIEMMARERVDKLLQDANIATKEDIARIESRLDALERTLQAAD